MFLVMNWVTANHKIEFVRRQINLVAYKLVRVAIFSVSHQVFRHIQLVLTLLFLIKCNKLCFVKNKNKNWVTAFNLTPLKTIFFYFSDLNPIQEMFSIKTFSLNSSKHIFKHIFYFHSK